MKVLSVNVGRNEISEIGDHRERTGIVKRPVSEPLRITRFGVEGDFIANKKDHGGPDQAIYIYGSTDYDWWSHELRRKLAAGMFGENLTISDLESATFSIGDRLLISGVILEVSAARIPCKTFARRMGDPQFINLFREAERPGLYCRVIREGMVQAGEEVTIEPLLAETVTLIESFRAFYEANPSEEKLRKLLRAPLAARARAAVEEKLDKLLMGK
jgi:MOSC domain-containing protein YiiM